MLALTCLFCFIFSRSITGTPGFDGENIPEIFQISLTGLNDENEIVRNSLGVVYTNACGVEPIFEVGEKFGWLIFVSAILLLITCACFSETMTYSWLPRTT